MERRVVITGLGAVTPIGNNAEEFWKGIKEGKCGIDEITRFDTTNFKVKLAAELKDFNAEDYFDRREAKRLDRFSQYAMVASREAWKDSGLDKETENMERVGIMIGSGIGGIGTTEEEHEKYMTKGPDRVSPMYIPMGIPNMATGNVAIDIGAKGESIAMVTACASGTHSIGESFRMIKHGYQDVVLTGGTEAGITPLSIAGFTNIKALTQSTEWIQYALESGLLSMIQVDDEQQWVSTMYWNCSDITEDTIDLEITKAEAEYKRETQKIQAKDQRYDLELKNIDTEHESLQTEYDSIKSVIDKNVERSFKIFS